MNLEYNLTVLICVHSNNERYDSLLLKSLKSLENQTYKNFKTLIVLDECWEQTKKIIQQKNLNLKIQIEEKNKKNGLAEAKNFGLSFIETDLVAFLDGDDLYSETKLEKQMKFLTENPDIDFLGTQSWNIFNENDNNLIESCFVLGTYENHFDIKNRIFQQNVLTHGSMLIKKKCLDELNGYHDVKGMEDWNLWKRAIDKGFKFHQIQERLYIYRLGTSIAR
jgi:glycosyltransferase involved in cell wall biosynthesis